MKTYFITDPCYIFSDKEWNKAGKELNWELENIKRPYKIKRGIIIDLIGTSWGDGSYENVGVDSGTLCIAEMSDKEIKKERWGKSFFDLHEAKQYLGLLLQHI